MSEAPSARPDAAPVLRTGDPDVDRPLAEAQAAIPDAPDLILARARKALDAARARGHAIGEAYAEALLGYGHHLASDHERALPSLLHSVAELETHGDVAGRGSVVAFLASVHSSMGHFDEAIEAAHDALRSVRATDNRATEGWILVRLANDYLELGDLGPAMKRAEAALSLFADGEIVQGQARAHGIVGGALVREGRHEEARAHHEAALRLAREAESRLTQARALHDLGEGAQAAGRYEEALDFHEQALAIRRALANRQAQSSSLLRIGQALTSLGRPGDAIATLDHARSLAEETGAELRLSQIDRALAEAHENAGDAARALNHYRRHQERREAMLGAQARSRVYAMQVRAQAEQAQQDAEIAHLRNVEMAEANAELERALADLRQTQGRMLQQEKLASLGRLASGVAHELQNPLNFVANFAAINADYADEMRQTVHARRAELPPDLADDLEELLSDLATNVGRVREHAERASGIVRSLIGHGQPSSGKREEVDLREIVGRVVRVSFAGSDVRPVWVPGAEPVPVLGDAQALDRALVNLVDNARRAVADLLEADGDFRAVVCVSLDRVDGDALLRVMDNGPGVDEPLRDRIFEPFFSTRPTGEGTGLGLPLARQIVVEGHGGDLTLEPSEAGASFAIRLPLVTADG